MESFGSCKDLMKTADEIEAPLGIGVHVPFTIFIRAQSSSSTHFDFQGFEIG